MAILAGRGALPVEAAREARRRGEAPVVVALVGGTDPGLSAEGGSFHRVPLGELERLLSLLRAEGVVRALLAGKVTKELLFRDFVPDERMAALLSRVADRDDDTLLLAVVEELAAAGVTVQRQDEYLGHLLAPAGLLSRRAPDEREWADIRYGFARAKEIAGLDLGQTVVVKNLAVLAVEAIEGTDACLRRGGELGRGGSVAVKVAKPRQDPRFDVPTVGPETLVTMASAGISCLAVEAGATFLVDRPAVGRLAEEHGLSVVGI
ncbi:MAG: UDP-2,3-diacylglucosamine diphosphatase LpxI [Bacillota bacterium]|nr:UDP-2,3-diacylglucosamine diphosphatase LpxI [Bacillota bacterium]